jgi:hypothetical protein
MVHDGDQNKSCGDAGQSVYTYTYPGPAIGSASISGYVTGVGGVPLSGVAVTLIGTDVKGDNVDLTAITDGTGFYSFTGLWAGNYTVERPAPVGTTTFNTSTPGTVSGATDGAVDASGNIAQITLGPTDQGINYDFGEVFVAA